MPAICRAVHTGFELFILAHIIATDRADATILLAAGAVLAVVAHPVAAPLAVATILRAGETCLGPFITLPVSTRGTDITVCSARQTIFTVLGTAKSVAAGFAHTAVTRTICAGFIGLAGIVSAALTESTIDRAIGTGFVGIADLIAAGITQSAILWTRGTVFVPLAPPISTRVAFSAIGGAPTTVFIVRAFTVAATVGAFTAVARAGFAGLIAIAALIPAFERTHGRHTRIDDRFNRTNGDIPDGVRGGIGDSCRDHAVRGGWRTPSTLVVILVRLFSDTASKQTTHSKKYQGEGAKYVHGTAPKGGSILRRLP